MSGRIVLRRTICALWLGAAAFILLVVPAVFRAAGDPGTAADVVGAILTRWHYFALLAPLTLLVLEWKYSRSSVLLVLFVAILLASAEGALDVRIRMIREASSVPISSLDSSDPIRRQFGLLHGVSSMTLVAQLLAAFIVNVGEDQPSTRPPVEPPAVEPVPQPSDPPMPGAPDAELIAAEPVVPPDEDGQ